jgi:hypothetical protein
MIAKAARSADVRISIRWTKSLGPVKSPNLTRRFIYGLSVVFNKRGHCHAETEPDFHSGGYNGVLNCPTGASRSH